MRESILQLTSPRLKTFSSEENKNPPTLHIRFSVFRHDQWMKSHPHATGDANLETQQIHAIFWKDP